MLELENARVIGMGNDRRVYQDPQNPRRCIKVPRYPDKGSRQNQREQRYFEGLVRRGMRDWTHVPAYHGSVATHEGLGLVFDLILDGDGTTSRRLREVCKDSPASLSDSELIEELASLYHYLDKRWLIPSDLNDRNVVVQFISDQPPRLWLIDGISNPDFLPLATGVAWLARRKIARRYRHFLKKLLKGGQLTPADHQQLEARLWGA
ncbi:YrbL family protein [Cobetia crustatorum]|uniref:YrbL family protein n=1 Tax=Cobetia crustatorum TaxID=553385 RepID=UPI000469B33F|nr:YrbL family protein [Cobetia crustatorum]